MNGPGLHSNLAPVCPLIRECDLSFKFDSYQGLLHKDLRSISFKIIFVTTRWAAAGCSAGIDFRCDMAPMAAGVDSPSLEMLDH